MSGYTHFTVQPLSGSVGAILDDMDISRDLSTEEVAEIRRAWHEHLVIFFRNQMLSDERLMAFGRRFGDLYIHPNLAKKGPHPEVIHVVKEPEATRLVGAEWHTDTGHVECPPMGAILYALELPPKGGDTLFANQYLAYETLSDGLKSMLDRMKAYMMTAVLPDQTPTWAARQRPATTTIGVRRRTSIPSSAPIRRPGAKRST